MGSVEDKGKRQRLSRERVLDAAIAIARAESISGVSMPSVSRSLGTTPMSLYRHVGSKEQLLLGMLARATAMIEAPVPQNDPVEEVMSVFLAVRAMLRTDPWTVQYFLRGYRGSKPVRALTSRSLVALEDLGLAKGDAWHAHQALLRYTYGEVLATGETATPDGLNFEASDEAPTTDDETIHQFSEAANPASPDETYRETLRRYLHSVVSEVQVDGGAYKE